MRVLQIGSDRSKRGILYPDSDAFRRQQAYAKQFGDLDIIGFSLRSDDAQELDAGTLRVHPTHSHSKMFYVFDAITIARALPRPDVVSVQDPFEVGFVGWLVAYMRRSPLYVQVHTDFLSPAYVQHSVLNKVRVRIAGFVLRRAARIRVVSDRIKEALVARYGISVPIDVLPIYADLLAARAAADPTITNRFTKFATRLLIVARLEPEKNVALAIEAFSKSAPEDACLIIVGDGSQRHKLETLAEQSGTKRIFFEGQRDVAPYYSLVDLVLVPSKYEGYGLVIVEALAAGKPVLATDVGVARESGAIIADPEHFVAALSKWFKNGPREASLKRYPYHNFEEYVRAYGEDVAAAQRMTKPAK